MERMRPHQIGDTVKYQHCWGLVTSTHCGVITEIWPTTPNIYVIKRFLDGGENLVHPSRILARE